jgi:hypothetical protein
VVTIIINRKDIDSGRGVRLKTRRWRIWLIILGVLIVAAAAAALVYVYSPQTAGYVIENLPGELFYPIEAIP